MVHNHHSIAIFGVLLLAVVATLAACGDSSATQHPESGWDLREDAGDWEDISSADGGGGQVDTPCLQVEPADEIDFGRPHPGQAVQKTVTIENCSRSRTVEVRNIELTDDAGGAFAIRDGSLPAGLPNNAAVLEPGDRVSVVVLFRPSTSDTYSGVLTIESDDPANGGRTELALVGRVAETLCPTARATANIEGSTQQLTRIETIPLNTIEFDGSRSSASDLGPDESLRYEWTILSRPQGSTQRLAPSDNSPNPRLFLDVVGIYEVELKVFDPDGTPSCGAPAIITIRAVPDDDVYVQLVWETPGDADRNDNSGTDLDLHYLHPHGRWDDPPWDVFWRNSTADWGQQGNSADDPRLDIDDTDGVGPESINHSGLENLNYRVGVYYYSSDRLGRSDATVRIFIRGQLEFEVEAKPLERTGDFWDVAFISWPAESVTPIDRLTSGFP